MLAAEVSKVLFEPEREKQGLAAEGGACCRGPGVRPRCVVALMQRV